MDAAVAALIGAAVGVVGSLGGTWIQQRTESRRDRLRLAAKLGEADFNFFLERAKKHGGPMPPISLYVAYHADVLQALAEDDFTPKRIAKIEQRQTELIKALPLRYKPDEARPDPRTAT